MRIKVVLLVGSLLLAGCSSQASPADDACPPPGFSDDVTVLAASSTKNVLTDLRDAYLQSHPCVTELNISFGSSSEFAAQIINGAPVDVFLAANETTKDAVLNDAKLGATAQLVARNKMAILINTKSAFAGAIQKLTDLQDVVNPDIAVGVCVETAPCGAILPQLFEADELAISDIADTTTNSVQDLVTKVVMGELDAGIVFGSDCEFARRTKTALCVDIVQDIPNPVSSPLYVLALNKNPNTRDLVAYLASDEVKALLQKSYGFLAP